MNLSHQSTNQIIRIIEHAFTHIHTRIIIYTVCIHSYRFIQLNIKRILIGKKLIDLFKFTAPLMPCGCSGSVANILNGAQSLKPAALRLATRTKNFLSSGSWVSRYVTPVGWMEN
jgi:hypothetical protein